MIGLAGQPALSLAIWNCPASAGTSAIASFNNSISKLLFPSVAMCRRLIAHLLSSWIFHCPGRPFIDLEFQNPTQCLRVRTFHQVVILVMYDYSGIGSASLNLDHRFAPMVPFYFECSSTYRTAPGTPQPPLSQSHSICAVTPLEFADSFSTSLSCNPLCFGFTYSGANARAEFIYNGFQEQPGFTGLFHWNARNTQISLMTSKSGVAALITTKLGIAKVSCLTEANRFTLESSATHGVNSQYRDIS
jgi:hypothetical protein